MWIFTQVKGGEGMLKKYVEYVDHAAQHKSNTVFRGRFTLHSRQSTFVHTLHFSSSVSCIESISSIMSSHHGIPETSMVPEHQWLDIGRWHFDPFESKDLFVFRGEMAKLRRSFFGSAILQKDLFFQWLVSVLKHPILNDEQKIRSQGGVKKGGGGMSEPPSSPAIQSFGHHCFKRVQGVDGALNLRVVGPWASWPGGNFGRFEPLDSPNPGGQNVF